LGPGFWNRTRARLTTFTNCRFLAINIEETRTVFSVIRTFIEHPGSPPVFNVIRTFIEHPGSPPVFSVIHTFIEHPGSPPVFSVIHSQKSYYTSLEETIGIGQLTVRRTSSFIIRVIEMVAFWRKIERI
jgi:hypothetical protein